MGLCHGRVWNIRVQLLILKVLIRYWIESKLIFDDAFLFLLFKVLTICNDFFKGFDLCFCLFHFCFIESHEWVFLRTQSLINGFRLFFRRYFWILLILFYFNFIYRWHNFHLLVLLFRSFLFFLIQTRQILNKWVWVII